MAKDFAGLLAQVVPVLALAIGLELRSLSQHLKGAVADYQESGEAWTVELGKLLEQMRKAHAAAQGTRRWGLTRINAGYRALRAFTPDPGSEIGQYGMIMLLILALIAGQAYFSGVEFYALTVAAGEPYRPLMSVLGVDLMAQLRTVIDVAFLAPAVEAGYRAIVFILPVRGARGKRLTTVAVTLGGVLALRFAFGLLFR